MAIVKMSLVSVEGPLEKLDNALLACCQSNQFQLSGKNVSLRSSTEQNEYRNIYSKVRDMAVNLKIPATEGDGRDVPYETPEEFEAYFDGITARYDEIYGRYTEVQKSLEEHIETDSYVKHLKGMDANFGDLFAMKYVKVRIGRLPADSESKLAYYESKCFVFLPFERNPDYVYGIYLVPVSMSELVDNMMTTLGFERTRLPDYLHENAEDADKLLAETIEQERKQKEQLEQELAYLSDELRGDFTAAMFKLKAKADCFELRRKAVISGDRFSFSGYCPTEAGGELSSELGKVSSEIQCIAVPVDKKNAPADVPIKLKNNRFTRPFEMFVKMYGLPTYGSFDPTPYVAFTYMLMFGIMFGDVGQGLVVSLLGLLLTKFTKNGLAPIMTRLGLFSAAFGCVYGSVFGIETIIKPIYHRENIWNGVCSLFSGLGINPHPENIFEAAIVVLLFSLAIGIVLILISMVFNMVLKFRSHDLPEALFGVNGVAGITLYASLVFGLVASMLFGLPVMNAAYVICLIVVPAVVIFFKHPLGNLITHTKSAEKVKVGSFIIENFIELFETAISFLSNTMSYLRIGGFVLSHAGFMLVVSQMAGTTDPTAPITVGTVITYIIGNIIVMAIEGLLSGIQVLRLEFYEIFSRFYDGGGTDFKPVKIGLETE